MSYEEARAKCGAKPFETSETSKARLVETVAALVAAAETDPRRCALLGLQFKEFG